MTGFLQIRVTPRSSRAGIIGWRIGSDGREELEIRVAEAPAGGAANEAVLKIVAKALKVSRAEVEIVSGAASRHKRLSIPFGLGEARRRLGG